MTREIIKNAVEEFEKEIDRQSKINSIKYGTEIRLKTEFYTNFLSQQLSLAIDKTLQAISLEKLDFEKSPISKEYSFAKNQRVIGYNQATSDLEELKKKIHDK